MRSHRRGGFTEVAARDAGSSRSSGPTTCSSSCSTSARRAPAGTRAARPVPSGIGSSGASYLAEGDTCQQPRPPSVHPSAVRETYDLVAFADHASPCRTRSHPLEVRHRRPRASGSRSPGSGTKPSCRRSRYASGPGEACELRIAAPEVGRPTQCVLEPLARRPPRREGLGSGYPTRVNGTEIQQVSLSPGDVHRAGGCPRDVCARGRPSAAARARSAGDSRAPLRARHAAAVPRSGRPAGPRPHRAAARLSPRPPSPRLSSRSCSADRATRPAGRRSGASTTALDLYRDKDFDVGARDALRDPVRRHARVPWPGRPSAISSRPSGHRRGDGALELMLGAAPRPGRQRPGRRAVEVFLQRHGPFFDGPFDEHARTRPRRRRTTWRSTELVDAARARPTPSSPASSFARRPRRPGTPSIRRRTAGTDLGPVALPAVAGVETRAAPEPRRCSARPGRSLPPRGPRAPARELKVPLPAFEGTWREPPP